MNTPIDRLSKQFKAAGLELPVPPLSFREKVARFLDVAFYDYFLPTGFVALIGAFAVGAVYLFSIKLDEDMKRQKAIDYDKARIEEMKRETEENQYKLSKLLLNEAKIDATPKTDTQALGTLKDALEKEQKSSRLGRR